MTRILHVLAQQPGQTGSGIFLENLLREALKKGHKQAVIAGVPSSKVELVPHYVKSEHYFPVLFELDGLPFPVVGMSDVMPYPSTRYRELSETMFDQWRSAFTTTLRKAVTQFQPDVVLSHHLWLLSGLTKELFPDIPMIVLSHGTGLRQLQLAPQFAERVIKGCQNIEIVLALNEYQKEKIIAEYALDSQKIVVNGCGYSSELFYREQEKSSPATFRLIYAGKLSYAKGVPSLMRVYGTLTTQHHNLSLTLVGSGTGAEEQEIRALAKDTTFPIHFTGSVPQSELAEYFRKADVFILPSFYEGLPLVVIEALASGLRVVTTDVPGLKDWLGPELNLSGFVEYVPLPALIGTDKPVPTELPGFEDRLGKAIDVQLERLTQKSEQNWQTMERSILNKSWTQLFCRIEGVMARF